MKDNLEIREVRIESGNLVRRFVVVHSLQQAEGDRQIRDALGERLEAEDERLNKSRSTDESGRQEHTATVCALKSHSAMGRQVRELKSGELRVDRGKVAVEEKLDGKYLLSTTDPSLTAEQVALGYEQLAEVERAFRTLKHALELKPLDHRLPDRIRSHVLLCWMALLLVRIAETETEVTWTVLRDELEQLHRVTLRTRDGSIDLLSDLTTEERKALRALKIATPKLVQKPVLAQAHL